MESPDFDESDFRQKSPLNLSVASQAGTNDVSFETVTSTNSGKSGTKHSKRRKRSPSARPKRRPGLRSRSKTPANKIRKRAIVKAHNTKRSRQPLLNYTLDDILSNKRKTRNAAPRKLKETDPILDAFKEIDNKEDLDILMQPNSDDERKNRKSSCVSKEDLDTESGTVQVKEYALKRRKKKVKAFHCASDGCDQMETSRKAINLHEKENHPDISYNCTECGARDFSSYEAMFKHSQ